MNTQLPSLITTNPLSGMVLAGQLAEQLHIQLEQANDQVAHPGGTNYLVAAPVPREVISSVLFYAIAAANGGWHQAAKG
jgi:hypothetical protein